ENFEQLLVDEWIRRRRVQRERTLPAGEGKRQGAARLRRSQGSPDLAIAIGRTKAHHHILLAQDRLHPTVKAGREIKRRKRPLTHDYGMHKLNRDVLRIGSVGAAPESQQPPALEEAL